MYSNIGYGEIFLGALIVLAIMIIPAIFYLLTLQKALNRCSVENRTMTPGTVWLLLIPLFNIVWQFIVVIKISESLHNEFVKRNIQAEPQPGKSLGLAFCILGVCSIIPLIGFVASLAALICWIMYWVKISGYSNKLVQPVMA